jgi:hypothetical protein
MGRKEKTVDNSAEFDQKNEIAQGMAIPEVSEVSSAAAPGIGTEENQAGRDAPPDSLPVSPVDPTKPGDHIFALPDDVKESIIGYDVLEEETYLLKVLGLFPHAIKVDRILMTLWIKHQKKIERTKCLQRLRKLTADGYAFKVEGKLSSYGITDEGRSLLGVSAPEAA